MKKLHEINNRSLIFCKDLLVNDVLTEEILFYNLDTTSSYCLTREGLVIHLPYDYEVEYIRPLSEEELKEAENKSLNNK